MKRVKQTFLFPKNQAGKRLCKIYPPTSGTKSKATTKQLKETKKTTEEQQIIINGATRKIGGR